MIKKILIGLMFLALSPITVPLAICYFVGAMLMDIFE